MNPLPSPWVGGYVVFGVNWSGTGQAAPCKSSRDNYYSASSHDISHYMKDALFTACWRWVLTFNLVVAPTFFHAASEPGKRIAAYPSLDCFSYVFGKVPQGLVDWKNLT